MSEHHQQRRYQQVIGFDFGVTKIGIATGQSLTGTATPLTVIKAKEGKPNWLELDKLINDWKPDALIVGNPLNMDGSESDISPRAKKFSRRLSARYQLDTVLIDERLSTREARERAELDSLAGAVDAIAAAIILESWFRMPATESS